MYRITLEKDYNRIELSGLDREEAVGIMFDLAGHVNGSIKLEEEKEEPQTGGNQ